MTATTTTNTTKKQLSPEELLAKFNLDVHDRAFQMQKLRSGLLSNSDSVRTAVFEQFSNGFIAIKNAIDYTKLLGGESKAEQIQAMKDFVLTSSGSTKEASDIVQYMLDKFSTEYQISNCSDGTTQVSDSYSGAAAATEQVQKQLEPDSVEQIFPQNSTKPSSETR